MSKRDRRTDPIPPEHRINPHVRLAPEQLAQVEALVANPPAPPAMLATPRAITFQNTDPNAYEVTAIGRDMITGEPRTEVLRILPPPGTWWNNLRRAWFTGTLDAPVLVDPQPPAPTIAHHPGDALVLHSGTVSQVPPSVKVSA